MHRHAYSDAMETHTRRIHLRRVSIGDIPRKGRADGGFDERGAAARGECATGAERARNESETRARNEHSLTAYKVNLLHSIKAARHHKKFCLCSKIRGVGINRCVTDARQHFFEHCLEGYGEYTPRRLDETDP